MGQLILPAVRAATAHARHSTDATEHARKRADATLHQLLGYNAAQLANTSFATNCHQLYDDALKSSLFTDLLATLDCFQDELTRKIDYDLYTMILGIGAILACMVINPTSTMHAELLGAVTFGTILVIAGSHLLFCINVDASSSLCDPTSVLDLAILLLTSGLIAGALIQIAYTWRLNSAGKIYHSFRDFLFSKFFSSSEDFHNLYLYLTRFFLAQGT